MVVALAAQAGEVSGEASAPGASEGVALAVVFDTSGSMKDPVRDRDGKQRPKLEIGLRALRSVIDRIDTFQKTTARPVECGLVVFNTPNAKEAVPFGKWNADALRSWAESFRNTQGGTPLGVAVDKAARLAMKSPMAHRHVLVITDGESNVGRSPNVVLPELRKQAEREGKPLAFHFVAFDIKASLFDPLKKEGAGVFSAADAKELETQLSYILERKILLEDEEAPKAAVPTQPKP